ncbi:MAG: bifunctional tetrahydrofolate synthase/dihydrofolate synthase [Ferrovum sp.]|nr:bifunctional tetrahydrofolate synthase/dihydrofolate synthase [Ferrovum sp.]NDU88236.1 bifunctional tetrahydrofolate synthase/dihydrofolate synthase [Ferrovum sp.]
MAETRTLEQWLDWQARLHSQVMELGLERVSRVRDALGLFPSFPVFMVAGTNGKGSTCATLTAVLKAAGYRVGTYTSPHLVRYNERIALEGQGVDDGVLCRAFERIEAARQGVSLTLFEFGTLAAMLIFIEQEVDVAVLEVGLGGRLDAVNVFAPDCALITSIALDHEAWLGSTREAIGAEKAGIFREGSVALCADPDPPASILEHADKLGVPLWCWGRDFGVEATVLGEWVLRIPGETWGPFPPPRLAGAFQTRNAALALAGLWRLKERIPVTPEACREGLSQVTLAGRFQVFGSAPQVILDVAHNPHAATELAANLRQHSCAGKTRLVFGMLQDKDIQGVVNCLDRETDRWYAAALTMERGASREQLVPFLATVRAPVSFHDSPLQAFDQACREAAPEDRVVVCGSFMTVGQILAHDWVIPESTTGV